MTVLMYLLPPTLRQLRTEHPQLEITLKAGLTTATLQLLKTNALDLGICALPVKDSAFEISPLFDDELLAIFPATFGAVPKKVTPDFMVRHPLILGNEASALRQTVMDWLGRTGAPVPKPVMEFDNVEAIKSLVAVGLGASIVPSLSLGPGHAPVDNVRIAPLSPRTSRRVALVQLRGKRTTEGMKIVAKAIRELRPLPRV
jgi:DNA-binding transcriptional LysR family regulator